MAGVVKVILNGTTLIDHSDSTIDPTKVLSSYVGYEGDGDRIVGTATGGGTGTVAVVDVPDSHGGIEKRITAVDISDTTATAADVAQGKYFYNKDGIKTIGIATSDSKYLNYYSAGNIQALIFNSAYFITDYYDTMQNLYAIMVKANTSVNYEHFFGMTAGNVRTGAQRSGSSISITTYAQGTSGGAGTINTTYPISFVVDCLDKSELMATLPLTIGAGYYNGALENIKTNMTFYGLNIINSNGNYIARFMPWLDNNSVPCIKELVLEKLYYPTVGTVGYIDDRGVINND